MPLHPHEPAGRVSQLSAAGSALPCGWALPGGSDTEAARRQSAPSAPTGPHSPTCAGQPAGLHPAKRVPRGQGLPRLLRPRPLSASSQSEPRPTPHPSTTLRQDPQEERDAFLSSRPAPPCPARNLECAERPPTRPTLQRHPTSSLSPTATWSGDADAQANVCSPCRRRAHVLTQVSRSRRREPPEPRRLQRASPPVQARGP